MSYRVQIDVYGDRDMNKEQTEKEERKNDKWFKIISLIFLLLGFALYTREMFTHVLLDRQTKVRIEKVDGITIYDLEARKLTVIGQKDKDESAVITITGIDDMQIADFKLFFSLPSDWENSLVTVTDSQGTQVYSKQYNGFSKAMALSLKNEKSLSVSNMYDTLIALAFGKGTRFRGDMFLFAVVCVLMIAEFLSYKLWEWVFLKHRIRWAVDRETIPSVAYKLTITIARFVVFAIILYLSVLSYGI